MYILNLFLCTANYTIFRNMDYGHDNSHTIHLQHINKSNSNFSSWHNSHLKGMIYDEASRNQVGLYVISKTTTFKAFSLNY